MAQNLGLRCILVPAPWVLVPKHVSNSEYRSLRHIVFADRVRGGHGQRKGSHCVCRPGAVKERGRIVFADRVRSKKGVASYVVQGTHHTKGTLGYGINGALGYGLASKGALCYGFEG